MSRRAAGATVTAAIDSVLAGDLAAEDAWTRHRDVARLLPLAAAIDDAAGGEWDREAVRARLFAAIARDGSLAGAAGSPGTVARAIAGASSPRHRLWTRLPALAGAAALLSGAAVVYAAQGAEPGSLLDPVREATQQVTYRAVLTQPEPTPTPSSPAPDAPAQAVPPAAIAKPSSAAAPAASRPQTAAVTPARPSAAAAAILSTKRDGAKPAKNDGARPEDQHPTSNNAPQAVAQRLQTTAPGQIEHSKRQPPADGKLDVAPTGQGDHNSEKGKARGKQPPRHD